MALLGVVCLLFLMQGCSSLTQDEQEVAAALTKLLRCAHVVIVGSPDTKISQMLSDNAVYVTGVSAGDLWAFLGSSPPVLHRTMILIPNRVPRASIQITFDMETTRRVTRHYLWVMFVVSDEVVRNVPYDCQFILVDMRYWSLKETYALKGKELVTDLGKWDSAHSLASTSLDIEYLFRRRKNMNRTTLFAYEHEGVTKPNKEIITYLNIWHDLATVFNFRTGVTTKWDLFDALILPVAFSPGVGSDSRIAPLMFYKAHMYIRKPGLVTRNTKFYVDPFHVDLWAAVAAWLVVATACCTIIQYTRSRHRFRLSDWCFGPFESLCNQSGGPESAHPVFRICTFSSRLLAAVLVPAFSAALVSYLAVTITNPPFVNLEGFVQDGTYTVGGRNHTYRTNYFQGNSSPLLATIREKHLVSPAEMPETTEEGALKMCREKFGLIGLNSEVDTVPPPCPYLRVRDPVFTVFSSMPLQRLSPFSRAFTDSIVPFYSSGLMKWYIKNMTGWLPEHQGVIPLEAVGVETVYHLLVLVPAGGVLAFIVLAAELFLHHWNRDNWTIVQ